jgi:paraquat-inducible protein A
MSNLAVNLNLSSLIACHECDLLHTIKKLNPGEVAKCSRCGATLYKEKENSITRTLSLAIAGLILYIPANFYPIIVLKVIGNTRANSLFTGVKELYKGDFWFVATLVLITSIALPLLNILALLYVTLSLRLDKKLRGVADVFRLYSEFHMWAMLEVYMLGILVALTKLGSMASVYLGIGLYSFIGLLIITVFSSTSLDPRVVWNKIEEWNRLEEK